MYANAFPGLDHYWRELSYNQVDVTGSTAYGWFNLPQPRSYYIYDMDSDSDLDTDFDRLATDCTAVADPSVYFPDFEGVNLMFNADLDSFSYGGGYTLSLDSVTQAYRSPGSITGLCRHLGGRARDGAQLRPAALLRHVRRDLRQLLGCDELGPPL
jgi:hypothetical protein